ncbi:MAG: hypothetical protein JWO04_2126 [Gammaproteobacteria bacterium]|nr:hypothetical protein [Gammaproteobacteria bacterium]
MSEISATSTVKVGVRNAFPMLQRKCACGGSASQLTGDCADCRRDKTLRLQKKLSVGTSDDPLEYEADRAAERVLAIPATFRERQGQTITPIHTRPPTADGSELGRSSPGAYSSTPWRPSPGAHVGASRRPSTADAAAAMREPTTGRGGANVASQQPTLPAFQGRIGHDFGAVRVHEGAASAPVARAVSASPGATTDAGVTAHRPATVHAPNSHVPQSEDLTHGGSSLDSGLRSFFETRYGRDLSEVRIHTGPRSESWNDRLTSHAFTYGSHVWLGRGHHPRADFLLAHELAHVIQQRQPKPMNPAGSLDDAEDAPLLSGSRRIVRRLDLSLPFWVPLGAKGMQTGTDLHRDLLGIAQANNANLDIEAPAPNATAAGSGLGFAGNIDLYQGKGPGGGLHSRVGLFFDGTTGAQGSGAAVATATPKNHPRVSAIAIAGGNFNPFVTAGGSIDGIDKGPTDVKIGELKPASLPMLEKGEEQVGNYKKGMKQAAQLTNEWALHNNNTARWGLNNPATLPDSAVKFVHNGTDMKFNPASPRDDQNLVLATIAESSVGGKYSHRVIFNPGARGLPPIRGGLYAQLFKPGKGLWMYFARPKNLADARALARRALDKDQMTLANQVQDEIVDPLFRTPTKKTGTAPLLRNRRQPLQEAATPRPRIGTQPAPPVIQRAPKPPELQDNFKFAPWQKSQEALRNRISGPTASNDDKQKVASVELLEHAYKAEEALDKVSGTGKSTLPPKSSDLVTIVSGKGADRKEQKRNLADLGSWLVGWTSKPAEILGFFRDKFGSSFVVVANKLADLRDRIRDKFRKAFESHPSKPTDSKGKIIAKALLKALLQVAKVLIPRAVHLFMDAVVAGIKKKLAKVFDIDPLKMVDDTFGTDFKQWGADLENFQKDADNHVNKIVDGYTKELGWIKDVIDTAKTVGPILEAASIAIQCGKKPGWGCLLLLSKRFRECGMESALNICIVQKQIAGLVAELGPLANLPATMAQSALNVVKDAAPDAVKEVFSEPVARSGIFDKSEIECEDTPPELFCPGLMPGGNIPVPPGGDDKKTRDSDDPDDPSHVKPPPPPPPPRPPRPPKDEPETPPHQEDKDVPTEPGKGGQPGPPLKPDPKGPGAKPGELPAPEEVHKALNDLLNNQGPEGMEALAKLAQDAGMPDDAPLTAEQVKKLQDLLKKSALTQEELKKLAGGGVSPRLQGKGKPLERFLGREAHDAVLKQTLEKLRQKQYEFNFQEMATHKVHWKIMLPYKPGRFRNAPALMWDDNIRAAGVVDGEYGKCYDGGKVPLTVTKADMHEERTQKKLTIRTPFHDKGAEVAGGVCPPQPAGGRKQPEVKDVKSQRGKSQGGRSQGGQGSQDQGGAGQGGQGQSGGKAQPPPQGQGSGQPDTQPPGEPQQKPPESGAGTPGGEVNSRIKPGDAGDPPGSDPQPDEEQQEGQQQAKGGSKDESNAPKEERKDEEQKDKPEDQKYPLDVAGLAAGCGLPEKCAANEWKVDFEEIGAPDDGWQVMPATEMDPDGTSSMLNPPNKQSPFTVRKATDGSQDEEMVLTCEGKTCIVGKVIPSSAAANKWELVSGPLLDSLKAVLRKFLQEKRKGGTGRAERIHFF